jgi:hypothetical protein
MAAGPLRAFGHAWVALSLALALHVTDEALNDFLSVYNPIVLAVKARLGWFPVPVFTFDVWLSGLIAAIALLLLLSPLAYRGSRVVRVIAKALAVIMIGNAIAHAAGSVYFREPMPGVYSSPVLFAASVWLFREAWLRPAHWSAAHSQ